MVAQQETPASREAPEFHGSKYNNFGICATALMAVLEECKELSVVKSLLVMPLIMHDATVRFLGNQLTREREISALVSLRPDLFLNFNSRFISGLPPTLNAIQLLVETGYISFDTKLALVRSLAFNKEIGERALRIKKAAKRIAVVLSASEEELYLNLRVVL